MIDSQKPTLLPIASIDASNRIRNDYSHVEELAASIAEHGLLQPVVITSDLKLVAGGSRLRACQSLGWTEIPVTFVETIPEDKLRILEVEENIRRKDFSWQERVCAVARIHDLRWRQSVLQPDTQRWTQRQTGELLGVSVGHVNSCLALADLISKGDKEINNCDSPVSALKLLLERKEIEANRALAAATLRPQAPVQKLNSKGTISEPTPALNLSEILSQLPSTSANFVGGLGIGLPATLPAFDPVQAVDALPTVSSQPSDSAVAPGAVAPIDLAPTLNHICRLGDCINLMKTCEKVDHIITDIPYGIDMSNLQQQNTGMDVSSTAKEHDVDSNIALMSKFIPLAYETLKENGYCILFYDLEHHARLSELASTCGFKVQRWPLVWVKTSPCLNQAAQFNFTKATEFAMVLRKGNCTLASNQPNNFWIGGRDQDPRTKDHPFAKPINLWKWVLSAVAIKGQTILDPFAGIGSSTIAALEAGYKPIACELNPDFHARQIENVRDFYLKALKQ